jgi:hypothetical protein
MPQSTILIEFHSFIVTFSQLQFINMKKMFAKLGMPSLLTLAFLLSGMFFGANLQAQALTAASLNSGGIKVAATWKNSSEALQILDAEIASLDQTLSANGGPSSLKMKLTIYKEIKSLLESGLSVQVAAATAFYHYAPNGASDRAAAYPSINQGDWSVIYNNMISLLTL